ncbi:MAG: type II secretion system protein [Campylobacterota bacterium]|nr:type II secretion system protein [Campylobacterota bacterium]
MKKSAFTMLELVFVIVVIGILAAAIIPRMDRDTVYEASEQLLSHIKYTQHLAMTDNVYDDTDANWFQNRWLITFDAGNETYSISKGTGTSYALDPLTKQEIDGTDDYDLDNKYSATIDLDYPTGTAAADPFTLVFDHLGRPHSGVGGSVSNILANDLNITITASGETANIIVIQETGYSYIEW